MGGRVGYGACWFNCKLTLQIDWLDIERGPKAPEDSRTSKTLVRFSARCSGHEVQEYPLPLLSRLSLHGSTRWDGLLPRGKSLTVASNTDMVGGLAEFRQAAIVNTLRGCQLFAGLPPADLHAVADITVIKALDKGDYLFREGAAAVGFYLVQKGAINVHRVNAAGKEQVIHIFRAGESLAEATLATLSGYPADARALESSQVLLIQKAGFLALLKRQPELALRMLASMSVHLRALVGQLEDLTLKDVETRLANWLIKRCPDANSTRPVALELKTTKRVLAAELGTVSETFSRTLAKFRQQKLLTVKGKTVTVLSPARLTDLLRRNLGE
jgi:CRP/FNR family transcriptional regulator, dissimilatory nitrate respiration regulator